MSSRVLMASVISGLAGVMIGAMAGAGASFLVLQSRDGSLAAGNAAAAAAQASANVTASATESGFPGLFGPKDARIGRLPVAAGGMPEALLSGVQSNVDAGGAPGISLRLPKEFERAASGQTVRVTVLARRAAGSSNRSFAVAYSTSDVGNSGWRRFTLTEQLSGHSFVYDVPVMAGGYGDFIGLLPDPDGTNGAVQVARITAEVFPRGAAMPPPPAAADAVTSGMDSPLLPAEGKGDAVIPGTMQGGKIGMTTN